MKTPPQTTDARAETAVFYALMRNAPSPVGRFGGVVLAALVLAGTAVRPLPPLAAAAAAAPLRAVPVPVLVVPVGAVRPPRVPHLRRRQVAPRHRARTATPRGATQPSANSH